MYRKLTMGENSRRVVASTNGPIHKIIPTAIQAVWKTEVGGVFQYCGQ
jgi:hypothetical protein